MGSASAIGFDWYRALPTGFECVQTHHDPMRRSASWFLHRLPSRTEVIVDLSPDPVISLELGPRGAVERSVEGTSDRAELLEDTLTLTPAFAACEWRWVGNSFEILDVYIPYELLQSAWSVHFNGDPAGLNLAPKLRLDNPYLLSVMKSLCHVDGLAHRNATIVYETLTQHLIACLLGVGHGVVHRRPARGGLPSSALRRVIEHIDAHLGEDVSLATLAGIAGFSSFHFLRQFHVSTGQSPHKYLVERRLARARELLLRSDLPVGEIASRCGFVDASHFAERFRKRFGLAPAAFRRAAH